MLPPIITKITGQVKVPFGEGIIVTRDTVIGCEVCQELFSPQSPHLNMALQGFSFLTLVIKYLYDMRIFIMSKIMIYIYISY